MSIFERLSCRESFSHAFAINLSHETWTEHDGIYDIGAHCSVGCRKSSHDDDCMIARNDQVLESATLERDLAQANVMAQDDGLPVAETAPYILDVDLDYFHSERAINPDDSATFYRLVRNAIAVTVALEPECVEELRCKGSTITSTSLLARLKEHIAAAMS